MLKKNESASRGATGFTRLARVLSECLLVLGVILFLAVLVAPNLSLVSRASASVETGLKPADKIGVHQLWLWRDSEARVDEVLDQMSAAGVKWLRMDFGWADLEPVQGTWDFSGHQMVVDKANERGINILGILSTTPTWAGGGSLCTYPPSNLDWWNTYVHETGSRFAFSETETGNNGVAAWEIWNEQNLDFFQVDTSKGTKVEQYMELVRRASQELDACSPDAVKVLGGVAMSDYPGNSSTTFIEDCLTAGVAGYVDKIAYHPYVQNYYNYEINEDGSTTANVTKADYKKTHPYEDFMLFKLQELRALIAEYAAGSLGLWITEVGWSNAPNALVPAVDEATQAAYVTRMFLNYLDDSANQAGDVPLEKVFYFNFWDQCDKDNTIFRTNNGGSTWTRVDMRTWTPAGYINYTNGLEGIAAERRVAGDPSCDTVVAVGPSTTKPMSISSSAGAVWCEGQVPNTDFLNAISTTDYQHAWVVGGNGTIFYGWDWGLGFGWSPQASGTTAFLNDVQAVNLSYVWAVGDGGTILRTTNGGSTWAAVPPAVTVNLNGVCALDQNTAWVVGDGGTILKTINGGSTWTAQVSGIASRVNDVCALDQNTAWVVGDGGTILKTINGGSTWTAQVSAVTSDLNEVNALNGSTAWAAGDGAALLKTTDGGSSWTAQAGLTGADRLTSLAVVDASTVFVAGYREPVADDANSIIPIDMSNFGLLNAKTDGKAAFNYLQRLGDANLFGSASAISVDGKLTFASPPATLEKHLFQMEDGSLLLSLWNSDTANNDPDASVTFTLDGNTYLDPVLVDLLDGSTQAVQNVTRDGAGIITVSNLTIGQTPLVMKFTKVASPAPTVTGITPSTGLNNGALAITNLAGTNFRTGATVKLTMAGQPDINATSVSVVSSTKIICAVDLTGKAVGAWNVVATNSDAQSGTLANGFTIAYPAPTVTGITPSMGLNNGALAITNLAGTNFRTGATVKLTMAGQPDINATSVSVVSSTKIICAVDLTGKAVGAWNVVATNDDAQSGTLANGFTIAYPAPTVTGITPSMGLNNGALAITNLAGTNFRTGATVKLTMAGQPDINATSVSVVSSTKIICAVDLTGKAVGAWNVVATNSDAQSGTLANGFTIAYPAPTVTGITPSSGYNNGSVSVTNLAGTGFRAGATVKLTRTGYTSISATNVVVVSPTKITCTLGLSNATVGAWNVMVTNNDGKSYTKGGAFAIQYPTAPTVTSITPSNGTRNTTVSITNLAGTGFRAGATVKLTRTGYASVTATNVVVVSSTKITCKFALPTNNGLWSVVVTNNDGRSGTKSSCFTVK